MNPQATEELGYFTGMDNDFHLNAKRGGEELPTFDREPTLPEGGTRRTGQGECLVPTGP